MNSPAPRGIALLACFVATSVAQQLPPATETLDEVSVVGQKERERKRGPDVIVLPAHNATVRLKGTLDIQFRLVREQRELIFPRTSAARQLPEAGTELSKVNRRLRLELLPDRLIAPWPYIQDAGYLLAANVDEPDGLPAHIPFGPDVALVNLDYMSLRDSQRRTRMTLTNAMHPQTRRCESEVAIYDVWPEATNPYILLGNSLRSCVHAVNRREGDMLFAENVPAELRQAVQELYDSISSRLAILLGSEPGNMFIAWWPDSPHDGYRLQLSWNRNSLLLFNGSQWQQGIDAAQREALRLSLTREQIQRRIRESDWPGAFTESAVAYLLLLTRSGEDHTLPQRLSQVLPRWITKCAGSIQQRRASEKREEVVSSVECGLVLQFVYDAVARSRSAGRQDIYGIWRKLLTESFRRSTSIVTPADFLVSSTDARRIAQGLVEGNVDWPSFAAALEGVGVNLNVSVAGNMPTFEVRALKNFDK
jgi:hypothetical protein